MDSLHFLLIDSWDYYGDPRSKRLPFMSGPPYAVGLLVLLYVLGVKWLGPIAMRNRQPYELRTFMFVYNCFLVGFNTAAFLLSMWTTEWMYRSWDCSPLDPTSRSLKDNLIVYFGWMYFVSKFLDWMDTIFFVLRKKFHQASFLHVFHHAVMPLIGKIYSN